MNGTKITLYDLIAFREQMNDVQLARYGDYYTDKEPQKPFTLDELKSLKRKKDFKLISKQIHEIVIDSRSARAALIASYDESWDLMFRSQQQLMRKHLFTDLD